MLKPDNSPSAVVVSGGKQYRVALGDRILVDRIAAEPGSAMKLGRVLLFSDGNEVKVGSPAVDGVDVDAKVLAHRRGPRIESIRYKSKKRVRVHRGGRADLTALEIIAVGGVGLETEAKTEEKEKARPKGRVRRAAAGRAQSGVPANARVRGVKRAPDNKRKKVEEPKAEAAEETKPARRRSSKKASE